MIEQVGGRYGKPPDEWLVDGGYPAHEQSEQAAAHTTIHAPVPKPKNPGADRRDRSRSAGFYRRYSNSSQPLSV